jgi:hypothetical protein
VAADSTSAAACFCLETRRLRREQGIRDLAGDSGPGITSNLAEEP